MGTSDFKEIRFHYLIKQFYFPNRTQLKKFLLQQLQDVFKQIDAVNYIFCNDDYLFQINRSYLKHNTYTDIITFELSERHQPLLADIYISIERVRENAKTFSSTFTDEVHRVIFHGALHLVGYKDKSESQLSKMRLKENEWLSLYNVPREMRRFKD